MPEQEPIRQDFYDQVTDSPPGYRDKRGEWRPAEGIQFAPVFDFPTQSKRLFKWGLNYLFSWNLLYLGITLGTWLWLQPALERCATFQFGWIAQMYARNLGLLWVIYGAWHLYFYTFKKRGYDGKYSPRWQNKNGSTFLFKNQVLDNIFWTSGSGCLIWTAYEVVTMWMYANSYLPYIDFRTSPILFVVVLLLIPFWREFHFYWTHRLIHWKPLYDRIHYLHHYNINPGPWSGMAMHPVEHIIYFSVTLIHWIVPSHPIHFLYNSQHTAFSPAPGHTGFEGKLAAVNFGSYFHYLHHRHFDCNYGESTIPLDKWFGSFDDGARTDSEISEARRTYSRYVIAGIDAESEEVKSFYLQREDGEPLLPAKPGQHIMVKVPAGEKGNVSLRFYTISDVAEDVYRISVKRQLAPPGSADVRPGLVSGYLHDQVEVGSVIEARGPLGHFTPDLGSKEPLVLIAGGIGITPILAMLKACLSCRPRRSVTLLLGFRDVQSAVFRNEIDALVARHKQVKLRIYYSQAKEGTTASDPVAHQGRISIDAVREAVPGLEGRFYICGPHQMMVDLTADLCAAGVSEERIETESFATESSEGSAGNVVTTERLVTFSRSDKTLVWDADCRNLLEFAESNNITMEAGCMFGECGACAVKLVEGEVAYNHTTATTPSSGHCLPCSCQPQSNLTLDA